MNSHKDHGFTLIELIVVIAILTVILAVIGTMTRSVTQAVGFELVELEAQEIGESTLVAVGRNLSVASLLKLDPGVSVEFVVPVDIGEDDNGNQTLDEGEDANGNNVLDTSDGDYTAPDGTIQWGAIEVDGPRLDTPGDPHRVTLQFVAEATVSELTTQFDINSDGDFLDVFQRGHILHSTSDGLTEQYGRGAILFNTADPLADLNNDGVPDPLFSMEGETFTDSDGNGIYTSGESFADVNGSGIWEGRFRLNLWLFREFDDDRFILRNYNTTWELSDVSN